MTDQEKFKQVLDEIGVYYEIYPGEGYEKDPDICFTLETTGGILDFLFDCKGKYIKEWYEH